MASVAKHIQIARSEGPEAGLEFYLDAPSSKRHPAYAEITRKRTPETRLAAYCRQFADQLGNIARPRVTGAADKRTDAVQNLAENLAALLLKGQAEVEPEPEPEPEVVENDNSLMAALSQLGIDVGQLTAAMGQSNAGTTTQTDVDFITSGDAWEALIKLGDDPDFPAPTNPERPATNGQLFRLNTVHGVLSLNV